MALPSTNVFNHPSFDIPDPYVTDGPGVAGVITNLSAAAQYNENWGSREVDLIAPLSILMGAGGILEHLSELVFVRAPITMDR